MKAHVGFSFAKRSLVIAATALPSLYTGLANAQAAPPPPAPAVPPVPAAIAPASPPTGPVPPPIAGSSAPVAGTAEAPAPAVVTPATPATPAPPDVPPPAVDPMAEKYKHINMGVWMRVDGTLQNHTDRKKLNEITSTGEVEFHFS